MPKVSKRPDGRWETRVRVGTDNGKPKYRSIYGRTKKEAEEKLAEITTQLKTGTYANPSNVTLGEWINEWINGRPNIRETTRAFYDSLIRVHIAPALGDIKLNRLTTRDIQTLLNEKMVDGAVRGGGLSAATIRYIHVCIQSTLKQAVKERLLIVNPAEAVERPQIPPKEMKTLTIEQVGIFLEEAKQDPNYAAFLLDLSTGLRRGELLGIWWDDIDFEKSTLTIRRQLSKRSRTAEKHLDRLFFTQPKTNAGHRQLSLPSNVLHALKDHRKRQHEARLIMGGAYLNPDIVFATPEGGPLCPDSFYKSFKRILRKAGLPNVRFHDLRHTYATMALQAGISPKTIQAVLGHANISTTLNIYGHVTKEMHTQAAEIMGDILEGSIKLQGG